MGIKRLSTAFKLRKFADVLYARKSKQNKSKTLVFVVVNVGRVPREIA